ncbi:hypothetical protein ELS19_17250 [Halogeometricum borinquense]|uniref:Uncharacterized protein n=1 Tax=Halogeometricum borinquense TaxID=60847 RepID=A0A482T2L1_9EURY|nr:hypothetical protein [Halogeometricum borinquense]RYJ08302.1 hypothetical protein ELS19_17250 [Halogeometricum borinquense]
MGDVAVTRNGHTHAMEVDDLEGDIDVDLDAGRDPHVRLPKGVHVFYDDGPDPVATDGGTTTTTRTRVHGYGLSGQVRDFAMAGAFSLALVAGWLWGTAPDETAALVALFVAAGIGLIGYRSARADAGGVRDDWS